MIIVHVTSRDRRREGRRKRRAAVAGDRAIAARGGPISGRVAGPDRQPAYANAANPTMIADAEVIPLTDDPPGFPTAGPGAQRDQNWKNYLNALDPDGSRRVPVDTMPAALPKPEAVQDKGLRAIGAAGRQQGVSYAWGGNRSVDGPTRGTLIGDIDGTAHDHQDDQRIGFDCGGLVRFSMYQATGNDPFEHDGPQPRGTDLLDTSRHLVPVKGEIAGSAAGEFAQSGDVLVFGRPGHQAFSGSNTHHTAIYVGNGVVIHAPESGLPVRLNTLDRWANEPTDVLRPE